MEYTYELIHRPIGMSCQPKDYIEENRKHINRNGFEFGSVTYNRKLTKKELFNYNMEPIHKEGYVETGMLTKESLLSEGIKIPMSVIQHCLPSFPRTKENGHEYISIQFLKYESNENKSRYLKIYKELRKVG